MSSHILHEREVDRHNLRGRTFVVRRIVWVDDDRPSFDVDDLATGVCLTEESFDDEPGPEAILSLLERLLLERATGTLNPQWADEQVMTVLDDVQDKHTVRVHISDSHIVVAHLRLDQAITVEVDGRKYVGVRVPDGGGGGGGDVTVVTWDGEDNISDHPGGTDVSGSPSATVIELGDPATEARLAEVRARNAQLGVDQPVLLAWGDPAEGFRFVGPVIPNDPELDRFVDQELRHVTWWYLPLRTLAEAWEGND